MGLLFANVLLEMDALMGHIAVVLAAKRERVPGAATAMRSVHTGQTRLSVAAVLVPCEARIAARAAPIRRGVLRSQVGQFFGEPEHRHLAGGRRHDEIVVEDQPVEFLYPLLMLVPKALLLARTEPRPAAVYMLAP